MNSEIDICNIALAKIGADAIRSFDENNKRARICQRLYISKRDQLLFRMDWAFARGFAILHQVDTKTTGLVVPDEVYVFSAPADLIVPRRIIELSDKHWWRLQGEYIWVYRAIDTLSLYYTRQETNVKKFSEVFKSTLAAGLAVELAAAIAKSSSLARTLFQQYQTEYLISCANDGNIGSEYPTLDREGDSFI